MKIAFLCGSLSQRKDGVGDYTHRLVSHFKGRGIRAYAIALHDPHIDSEERDETSLRLPRNRPLAENVASAKKWIKALNPNWISFQFVPFAYDPRGILRGALPALLPLRDVDCLRHVMVHELWVGQSRNDRFKNKLLGRIQKRYVLRFLNRFAPHCLHTSNRAYIQTLSPQGWSAEQLPLFSNIPICHKNREDAFATALPVFREHLPNFTPEENVVAVVFGSVHPEWNPTLAVDWLATQSHAIGKRLTLAFLGRNGEPALPWKNRFSNRTDLSCIDLGEQSEERVSAVLQASDLGLATTPSELLGKSGSFLAMSEHGLPSIVVREDWIPRRHTIAQPSIPPSGVYLARNLGGTSLERILSDRRTPASQLKKVGDQMLASLELSARNGINPATFRR